MSGAAPIDDVLAAFRGAGRKVAANGRGWLVSCPGPTHEHGDRKPSLAVDVVEGGQVALYCHAGCVTDDVLAAVGLAFGDLFPEGSGSRSSRSNGSARLPRPASVADALGLAVEGRKVATDQLALTVESSGVVGGGMLAVISGRGSGSAAPPPVEAVEACTLPSCVRFRRGSGLDCSAVYEYRDPEGVEVLGSVHRTVYGVGSVEGVPGTREGFRPHTPDGVGGFRLGGSISGLYRHPELIAAARAATVKVPLVVVVCEGERDADAVNHCRIPGMVGVTNAGGGGKWKGHHSGVVAGAVEVAGGISGRSLPGGLGRIMTGAYVVVVGDDDPTGRAHVRSVVESLRSVNIPPAVAFPRLGKDLSEHFRHGGTLRDLRELSGLELVAATVGPVEHVGPVANPDRWLDKHDGLLVRSLALDITDGAPIMRDLSDVFWTYRGGVWTRDTKARVRAAVTARLGERTRRGHRTNVEEYLLGSVEIIEPATPQPDAINVHNGMLDWRTGRLRDHDPDDKSTVQLGAAWMPGATCPVVEAWLREVLPPDLLEPVGNSPGFIWEVLGYLCYSGNPLHKALLLLGAGRNGKGTFLRLVTALLGAANVSAVPLHSLVDNRFRVAELEGRLANIAGDLDSTWLESTALFKAITGGDSVTAERKYGAPFDFSPFAVPVYSANAIWGTPDTSAGYMSRWVVLPFPNSFEGVEDRGLDAALSAPSEVEGVLVRAVEGLRAVIAAGNFTEPPSVVEAFGRFRDESDPVSAFMRATTTPTAEGWVTRQQIWNIYQAWCEDNGVRSKLPRAKLYLRLVAAGWNERKSHGVRGFVDRSLTVEIVPGPFGSEHLEDVSPGA